MPSTQPCTIIRLLAPLGDSERVEIVFLMKWYGYCIKLFLEALKSRELREKLVYQHKVRDEIVGVLKNKDNELLEKYAELRRNHQYVLLHVCQKIPQIPLLGRMWKLALEESVNTVRTYWASVAAETKHQCWRQDWYRQTSKLQKDFIDWVLTANTPQFFHLLSHRLPTVSFKNLKAMGYKDKDKEKDEKLDQYCEAIVAKYQKLSRQEQKKLIQNVHKILKSVRKNIVHYPQHHENNRVDFDCDCWSKGHDKEGQYVKVMTHEPRKRMRLNLKGFGLLRGTLQLYYQKKTGQYVIHVYHDQACKEPVKEGRIVGIDQGFTEFCATSEGKLIGDGFGKVISKASDSMCTRGKGRNKLRAVQKKHKNAGTKKGQQKAKNIEQFNLGRVRMNKAFNRTKALLISLINHWINLLLLSNPDEGEEQIAVLVIEKLTTFTKNKHFPKKINRRLSAWMHGYVHDRILFKCKKAGIKVVEVNPAWTSVTCSVCGCVHKENRNGDKFQCQNCGMTDHADVNAAKVIRSRIAWAFCTLYMTPRQIKYYLENDKDKLFDK